MQVPMADKGSIVLLVFNSAAHDVGGLLRDPTIAPGVGLREAIHQQHMQLKIGRNA
jgi:hypothetical protein